MSLLEVIEEIEESPAVLLLLRDALDLTWAKEMSLSWKLKKDGIF